MSGKKPHCAQTFFSVTPAQLYLPLGAHRSAQLIFGSHHSALHSDKSAWNIQTEGWENDELIIQFVVKMLNGKISI